MPQNLEIKAIIQDAEHLAFMKAAARRLSGSEASVLNQRDIYFNSEKSRLKLRIENERGFLIAYERPNTMGPKKSCYKISPVPDPVTMEEVLTLSNGIKGEVKKVRELSILELDGLTVRVHIDRVELLGDFLEFEVTFLCQPSFA